MQLRDGWYGLPSFRFLGVVSIGRIASHVGLEYAQPSMMALTNLMSHPQVGTIRIASGDMRGVLRSAKDLGRVIALARLEGREGTEAWKEHWLRAIQECFPTSWKALLINVGSGLEELLDDDNAMIRCPQDDRHRSTQWVRCHRSDAASDRRPASSGCHHPAAKRVASVGFVNRATVSRECQRGRPRRPTGHDDVA